jgi:Pvc16 N-terminal domain
MAGFGEIASVGRSIELVLNTGYQAVEPVPEEKTEAMLVRTEDIDLPSVALRPGLSILLYRVDFDKTMRASWAAVSSEDGRAHLPLDLHYLLTAWADNAEHEHQVIGRTMHVLERPGGLSGPLLLPECGWAVDESVQLYLEDMPTEDLMRTFDSLRCEFRLSIPYIARAIVFLVIDAPGCRPGDERRTG